MYGISFSDVLQEVAFRIAKGALLACKTWPFARQKTAFWKGVDCQWVTRQAAAIVAFVIFYCPKVAGTALKQYICNASVAAVWTRGAGTSMINLPVMMKIHVFFRGMLLPLLMMAGLLSACTIGGEDDTDYGERLLQAGEVAPDFTIITDEYPDGIALAGLRGSYVLIEFWRSTCGDCRDVTPRTARTCSLGRFLRPERGRVARIHRGKRTRMDAAPRADDGQRKPRRHGVSHRLDPDVLPYRPSRAHRPGDNLR